MISANHIIGVLEYGIQIILLFPVIFYFWGRPKLQRFNKKWILGSILLALGLASFNHLYFGTSNSTLSLRSVILFTLILSPIFEEILVRYLLLGTFLESFKRLKLKDYLIFT